MLFKSGLVTQASGSLGGLVASHNAGGQYLRARTIPTDPASTFQVAVRNALAQLVVRWGTTLTQAQRDAWATYAFNTPVTNALGDSVQRSGQQMYLRGNILRIVLSLPVSDDAPTVFNLGDFTAPGATVNAAIDQVSVTFEDTDGWANEDDAAMIVSASRPQSPGTNFFKGPYRIAGQINGDSVTPPTSPAVIALPFPVTTGDKVFLQIVVSRADGRQSSPFRTVVVAA